MQTVLLARKPRERRARCGLGKCRICNCQAFRGSGNICEDCAHHYDEHATSPLRAGVSDSRRPVGAGARAQ